MKFLGKGSDTKGETTAVPPQIPAEAKPAKQPPVLYSRTQEKLKSIEARLGAPLYTYWNGARGSICHNDVNALASLLDDEKRHSVIYLYIKSDGGNGRASLRMVSLLRRHCERLVALVPQECASAATMLALGADEVQMAPTAYLTAVDTSLTHDLSPIDRDNDRVSVSLDEVKRVITLWKKNEAATRDMNPYHAIFQHIHPLVIGAVDRADSLSIMLCEEILSYHVQDAETRSRIAATLNSKYPSHAYPILIEEGRRIGLNVVEMDRVLARELKELSYLYSEMGQKASTDIGDTKTHSNEIINILERTGLQVYFQQDKDWFYRTEERRWIVLNDYSSWREARIVNDKVAINTLFF